jgi:hypothetical protein
MSLGIMQPYFFPYLGYISLIKHVDDFILFDEVQFIRHGWIERNRILKPTDGWQYIRVPLENHIRETKIKKILIDNNQNWKGKINAQLQHYKKVSPFFQEVMGLLEELFDKYYFDITSLNEAALNKICKYLNIDTPIKIFSKMSLQIEPVNAPDEWALNICKALNYDEYWNPPGGKEFFDKNKYAENQIKLCFHKSILQAYDQKRTKFEPGLSILDVMMFNAPDKINQMLDDYELS